MGSLFSILGEVHWQATAAEKAFTAYEEACARRAAAVKVDVKIQTAAQGEIMFAVDAFVAPLGRLSFLLFPHAQKKLHEKRAFARARRLRRLLGIGEDHYIGTPTALALRNDLMHLLGGHLKTGQRGSPQKRP